jgi:hypothetical protein
VSLKDLDCIGFGLLKNQQATVPPGAYDLMWQLKPWGNFSAFVDNLIAVRGDNQLGAQGSYIDWFMDGRLEDRIAREIAINAPNTFSPPVVATDLIQFYAYNGDTINHIFQVICDGRLCRRKPPIQPLFP